MWQSNMTAVLREAALFIPGYEYFTAIPHSPVASRDFDHLTSGYRLSLRPSYWKTPTVLEIRRILSYTATPQLRTRSFPFGTQTPNRSLRKNDI